MNDMSRLIGRTYEGIWRLAGLGARSSDSAEIRARKSVMTLIAMIIAFLAVFWGSIYVWLGYPLSGAIPLSYSGVTALSIVYLFLTKQFTFFRLSQLLLILLLPFMLQWSLGGFANGSIVMIWAFFTPLAALLSAGAGEAAAWLAAFIALTAISGVIDGELARVAAPMPRTANTIFFILNMGVGLLSLYYVIKYFVGDQAHTHAAVVGAQRQLERANATLRENEARIRELMLIDHLTGVGNRRYLQERLAGEFSRARRGASAGCLAITDLDDFKQINDRYGHSVGDRVLQTFARIIRDNIREADVVARYGGEEFVLLFPDTDCAEARRIAERIRTALEATAIEPVMAPVTASFGLTRCEAADTADTALVEADRALYRAKRGGKNCITVVGEEPAVPHGEAARTDRPGPPT